MSPTKSKPTSVVQQPATAAAATKAVQQPTKAAPVVGETDNPFMEPATAAPKPKAAKPAPTPSAAKPAVAAKASQPKPTKEDVVDFMVKRGANLFPNGLDATKDKTLIREAAVEARKRIAQNELSAKEAKKAESEKRRKYFLDREAAKIEAERKKLKEEAEKRKPGVKLTYGSNHLTQKQLDEMFDKYKSR